MHVIKVGFTSLSFAAISQSLNYIMLISIWHVIVDRPLLLKLSLSTFFDWATFRIWLLMEKKIIIEIIDCFNFVHCSLKSSNCLYMCLKSVGEKWITFDTNNYADGSTFMRTRRQ